MNSRYDSQFGLLQTAIMSGEDPPATHEGGKAHRIDDETALERFLILGTSGTFYEPSAKITEQNTKRIREIVNRDPGLAMVVARRVHDGKLALKTDPLMFLLALLTLPSVPLGTRREAARFVAEAARTGTMFLHWLAFRKSMGKSNRLFRSAIERWFSVRSDEDLILQAIKYDQRDGWSLRDALRLARPEASTFMSEFRHDIIDWIVHPDRRLRTLERSMEMLPDGRPAHATDDVRLIAYSNLRTVRMDPQDAAREISRTRLPREAVPGHYLEHYDVWEALAESMPARALVRNLGKLSSIGYLDDDDNALIVARKLSRAADTLHPFEFLIAGKTYRMGRGMKGKLSWVPHPGISEHIDHAYEASFGAIVPSFGEAPLVALDISGSMSASVSGSLVTAMDAEIALVQVLKRQFPRARFFAFSDKRGLSSSLSRQFGWGGMGIQSGITEIIMPEGGTRKDIVKAISQSGLEMGWTDLNLPLEEAEKDMRYTSVITLTDSETRNIQPAKDIFRRIVKGGRPDFRHAVVAFAANEISVADPGDPNQMDFVGISSDLPKALAMFLKGEV